MHILIYILFHPCVGVTQVTASPLMLMSCLCTRKVPLVLASTALKVACYTDTHFSFALEKEEEHSERGIKSSSPQRHCQVIFYPSLFPLSPFLQVFPLPFNKHSCQDEEYFDPPCSLVPRSCLLG